MPAECGRGPLRDHIAGGRREADVGTARRSSLCPSSHDHIHRNIQAGSLSTSNNRRRFIIDSTISPSDLKQRMSISPSTENETLPDR